MARTRVCMCSGGLPACGGCLHTRPNSAHTLLGCCLLQAMCRPSSAARLGSSMWARMWTPCGQWPRPTRTGASRSSRSGRVLGWCWAGVDVSGSTQDTALALECCECAGTSRGQLEGMQCRGLRTARWMDVRLRSDATAVARVCFDVCCLQACLDNYKQQLVGDPIIHTHLTALYGTSTCWRGMSSVACMRPTHHKHASLFSAQVTPVSLCALCAHTAPCRHAAGAEPGAVD